MKAAGGEVSDIYHQDLIYNFEEGHIALPRGYIESTAEIPEATGAKGATETAEKRVKDVGIGKGIIATHGEPLHTRLVEAIRQAPSE